RFLLVMKHPAAYSALLPAAVNHFPCFALVRNPLAVLASWNANKIAVREGRAPAAERIDASLRARLQDITDRIDRQLYLLGWFCCQFGTDLRQDHVMRYEVLVATSGKALACVSPQAAFLDEPLAERNRNPVYDWARMGTVAERLLHSEGAYW